MASWVRRKCIGRGSFGTVSVAVNKSDATVFAVKSVERTSCATTSPQLECLENEIRILRSLSSPYVVEYLGDDVSLEPHNTSYRNLHMEYLQGGPVADVAGRVDERIVRSFTFCLVSALKEVHSKGIVHCDVKGNNVLVGAGWGSAKLADFGSATRIGELSDDNKNAPMLPRGSPLWMAPEVIRCEYQGPESDVWSLGCTVIEMVTGKPAWEDCGFDTLTLIGFSSELPEFPIQLSELGRDFLEKCLVREPSQRWSCDQLLQHPFINSASPSKNYVLNSSPRCVLDCNDSEFEVDDDVETPSTSSNSIDDDLLRGRICKLAASKGAIVESDGGWIVVRGNDARAVAVEEGTSTEYADSLRMSEENGDRTGWEFWNSGGGEQRLEHVAWPTLGGLGRYAYMSHSNFLECGLACLKSDLQLTANVWDP
ncbi:mitogen-activated protein kinase kinase kinase NPK1-like [Tripterygium wilfordii]|uniref:Mitogen-activated protein kinase kinase kinase NPK1-like n=1 Tax=Tripterygium wilfordii TaxID=458696 RepID=A0A7J7BZM4_TRIWF|nr:mitogen-activated protein kinase kinase kinase NPK1-like [Tripterygium wilfordii]